jgi:hypothetical protein
VPSARGKPTEEDWQELLGRVARLHDQKPLDLLLIDSLANLSPMRSENDAVQMLSALTPLQELSARGVSTLMAHHPKKGAVVPGQAARGSGALLGYVDIILEIHALSHLAADRRRRLRAFSRHAATPANLIVEWSADGTDYLSLGTSAELDFDHGWPVLQGILEQADGPLMRRAILRDWPESCVRPAKLTLWKWLGRAVRERRVEQNGRGTRKDPFRYALPGMREKWQQKFLDSFLNSLDDPRPAKPSP